MGNHSEIIKKISSDLKAIKEPIELVLRDSGSVFEQIGTELQSVYSDAKDLAQLNMDAVSMVDGESGADSLSQMSGLASESLEMLESCRIEVSKGIETVEISANHLVTLYNMTPTIKKISRTLNIVALNIAMESSRSMEREQMFSFFVSEIRELSKNVNSIAQNMHEDAGLAHQKQMDAFNEISGQKKQLAHIADTAHDVVQDSIHRIEELMASSLDIMRMAGAHSDEISRQVGEIVVAIQFHDIARQQLEHVMDAFEDADLLCREGAGDSLSEDDTGEILGRVHSILKLQSAHVNQVVNEIGNTHEKMGKAFDEIDNESDQLVKRVTGLGFIDSNDKGKESCFSDLISGLEHLDHIMDKGHGMAHKIEEAMVESTETVSRLSGHLKKIEDISMDLHLKAINAVLMSMRLGEDGRTLAILAQDVTEVSKESNAFVTEVIDILKTLDSIAHEIKCSSLMANNDSQGSVEGEGTSLSSGVAKISNVYEKFMESVSGSIDRSNELKNKIGQTESELSFVEKIRDQLIEGRGGIDRLLQSLTPFSLCEGEDSTGAEYAAERYTMESERNIHEQALNQNSGPIETITVFDNDSGREKEESEFDDNIELF